MLTMLLWMGVIIIPFFLLGGALGIVWQLLKVLTHLVVRRPLRYFLSAKADGAVPGQ